MTKLLQEKKGKVIILAVISLITAILSYGYVVLHPSIGIDDTEIERYVLKGWEPLFNRPTLVIPGLILKFDRLIPYLYDILGVLLIIGAALVWIYVFDKVSEHRIHLLSYCVFIIIFISSPIICETYIFYLHNGEGISFLMTAFATLSFYEFINEKKLRFLFLAVALAILSIGCYESMALVYMVTVIAICFLDKKYSNRKYSWKLFGKEVIACCFPVLSGFVFRSVISNILPKILKFDATGKIFNAHSGSLKYWFLNNPVVIAKDLVYKFIARYVISGLYFKWIIIWVILFILLLGYLIYLICKKKWIQALMITAMTIAPWLLVIYQMEMTPYRAMLGLMLWMPIAGLIIFEEILSGIKERFKTLAYWLTGFVVIVILLLQVSDSYKYYKLDYDVYQSDLAYTKSIYDYLNDNYNDIPVVFVGKYEMPDELKERAYLLYDSDRYNKISKSFNLDKTRAWYFYCDEYGYQLYDVGHVDPLSWACYADPGYGNGEVVDFCNMNGMNVQKLNNPDWEKINKNSPEAIWPESGSVVMVDEFVVVRIGK